MRTILLALGSALSVWSAQQEATRDFERTVTLPPGQGLTLDHQFGDVTVRGAARKDALIRATIRAASSDKADADRLVNEISIEVEQTAGGVMVRTKYPSDRNRFGRGKGSFSVAYDIVMPESASLSIKNSFGGVSVADMKANTIVRNGHGRLEFRNGRGTHQLENSFGAIEVAGNNGDMAITNGNGSVRASDVTGSVTARNSFGKVSIERAGQNVTVVNGNGAVDVIEAGGEANVTSSFGAIVITGAGRGVNVKGSNGSVRISKVNGVAIVRTNFGTMDISGVNGSLDAQNANGGVRISGVKGPARIQTTFGGVTASDLEGPVDIVNSNGSISATLLASSACQPVTIRNNFGPVKVWLADPANYNVAASTSFGKVSSEFPLMVSGQISSESVNGKIGNGGCELRVNNANGGIEILKGARK